MNKKNLTRAAGLSAAAMLALSGSMYTYIWVVKRFGTFGPKTGMG